MNDSLKTLLIIAFLILILWNLGAGLYYMMVDKGTTKRTVNALTRRIALSVALILLIALAIYMGWITPHGIGRAHLTPAVANDAKRPARCRPFRVSALVGVTARRRTGTAPATPRRRSASTRPPLRRRSGGPG